MKKLLLATTFIFLLTAAPSAQTQKRKSAGPSQADLDALKATLVELETKAWEAWKDKNSKYFPGFLSAESVNVHATGIDNRAKQIKEISNPNCKIKSYSLNDFRLVMMKENIALLTFKADEDYTCNGKKGASPVMASSLFIKRGDRWLNFHHQETPMDIGNKR